MPKLDLNLDAYRLAAECLYRIRHVLREALHAAHGDDWADEALPAEVHGYLVGRRDREATINWHLMDSCDLLDYAGFANLYEVITANPELTDRFSGLAPDPNVLRIRFLELDTILNRIAYVRPVSETEMGFLVSFDERLRKLASSPPAMRPERQAAARSRAADVPAAKPPAEPKPEAPESPSEPAPADRPSPRAVKVDTPGKAAGSSTASSPPTKPTSPPPATEPQAMGKQPAEAVSEQAIDDALSAGKSSTVLSLLYREITAMADGLWSHGSPPFPQVWERVRESAWYRDNFGALGLKPVSDFYGLVEDARERMQAGTSRNDLQEFLKERNFAQVLLALRELFRQHIAN